MGLLDRATRATPFPLLSDFISDHDPPLLPRSHSACPVILTQARRVATQSLGSLALLRASAVYSTFPFTFLMRLWNFAFQLRVPAHSWRPPSDIILCNTHVLKFLFFLCIFTFACHMVRIYSLLMTNIGILL